MSSALSSYNNAQEVDNLLRIQSPAQSQTHTPEGHFETLTAQMTTMEVEETGMLRGMQGSQGKGKQPEDPIGPSAPKGYQSIFSQGFSKEPGEGGSGLNPGTESALTVHLPPSKKRHIQKLENFTNLKDWDKFK
jgi:hypothetical protein